MRVMKNSGYLRFVVSLLVLMLSACGGGSGGSSSSAQSSSNSSSSFSSSSSDSSSSESSSSIPSSSSSSSAATVSVIIEGQASYDFIPHDRFGGLDYAAVQKRPVRRAQLQALTAADTVLATTATDENGNYSISVPASTPVRIRVLAQSQNTGAQRWDIRVEDNTQGNAIYTMTGSLTNSGTVNSARDLHAPSGWTGNNYGASRVAAPFAILDTAYEGILLLRSVDASLNIPISRFRWSPLNNTGLGEFSDGDIGTSFYDGVALYILGEEDADTDEYDRHVIAHEWGHYLEDALTDRVDSMGGSHFIGDRLDMRVAISEGFANGFSAILLDDPQYIDSAGNAQQSGGGFDVSDKNPVNPGWYSESSIQSIIYHFAEAEGFDEIHGVLSDYGYANTDSLQSIFAFAAHIQALYPGVYAEFSRLLLEQQIYGAGEYGEGESNNGNTSNALPVYGNLLIGGTAVRACSNQKNGEHNKLGVHQFLRVLAPSTGNYRIRVENVSGDPRVTDPDVYIYTKGLLAFTGDSYQEDVEEGSFLMDAGREYIVTFYDWNPHENTAATNYQPACFDVSLMPL